MGGLVLQSVNLNAFANNENACHEDELNHLNLGYLKALNAELMEEEDAEGFKQDGAETLKQRIGQRVKYMEEQYKQN